MSWDEADQAKALAWVIEDSKKCPRCGTDPASHLDEKGRHLDDKPYEAVVVSCLGCLELEGARSELPENDPSYTVTLRRLHPGSEPEGS